MTERARFSLVMSLAVAAAASAWSPRACADEPDTDAARTLARGLAEKGDAAFGVGRCDQAIPLWKEAARAYYATTIELRIAHCQALLGLVVEATATLEAMTKDPLPPTAPEAFLAAQAQAQAELPSVRERVATLVVEEPLPLHVTAVSIDDVALDPTKLVYPINPGRRRVRLATGNATWEGLITFGDGQRRSLAASTVLVPEPEPSHVFRNAGYVVGGAGIVSIGVGAFAGIAAITLGRPLDRECGPARDQCPADEQARITQVKTLALVSDVFLVAGVLLTGTGGFLVIRDLSAQAPPPGVRLVVTGQGASLRGQF
jgi:hypothetical protein